MLYLTGVKLTSGVYHLEEHHLSKNPSTVAPGEFVRNGGYQRREPDRMAVLSETYGASIFFRRWAAWMIDFILIVFGYGGLVYFTTKKLSETGTPNLGMVVILFLIGSFCYYLLLEGLTGYTLGKFVLRIQVVNGEGRPPGMIKSLIRTLIYLVDTNPLLFWGLPAGICVLVTPRKQRIGDMVANTYVVKVRDLGKVGRKKNGIIAGAIILMTIASIVLAVSLISTLITQIVKPEVFISKDNQFAITAPWNWSRDNGINEEADISIKNEFTDRYLIVLSEPKSDFDSSMTLQEYKGIIEDHLVSGITDPELGLASDRVVNGYPAIEFTLKGEVDGIPIMYNVTTIETPSHYHQVLAWTYASRYGRAQQELRKIRDSFREMNMM
ncbi:RDD family protein [Paenibacillus polymyxa]|uniref:RDD family protein n=1 Tax=Paenibacillus polymyxa TaxID=1406 RepID=UPI0025B69B3C|nr:RDD family protein [Paenibacillus polymyxa]MDN4080050.1 RDD family protein [Paenibacillus polymyxa]MDN4105128.1 RDD family protein [Paenibacillus polymyxa]MDN4115372.1 RDD family protein [Paenibacillus polymyxa]